MDAFVERKNLLNTLKATQQSLDALVLPEHQMHRRLDLRRAQQLVSELLIDTVQELEMLGACRES